LLPQLLLAANTVQTTISAVVGNRTVAVSAAVREAAVELLPDASADAPLLEAGLDSLGAVEFRNRLSARLDDAVELPETLVFDFPTLRKLEAHVDAVTRHALLPSASTLDGADLLTSLLSLGAAGDIEFPANAEYTSAAVRDVVAELLPNAPVDTPLMDAGLDSLGVVELRNRLMSRLSDTAVELPETVIFDFPTIRQLGTHLKMNMVRRDAPMECCPLDQIARPTSSHYTAATPTCRLDGSSCVLPNGVSSIPMLRALVATARNAVSAVPALRWDVHQTLPLEVSVTRRSSYGAFLLQADMFENERFSISQAEASAMDPQQRLLLQSSDAVLHQPGQMAPLPDIGIALGISATEFAQILW
jgi:acyl carrier protein